MDPDPDPHGSPFIFPPGSGSRKNARKLIINAFIKFFKSTLHLHRLHCFSELYMSLFFINFVKLDLDPDPHSEKLLDPDPQIINTDP